MSQFCKIRIPHRRLYAVVVISLAGALPLLLTGQAQAQNNCRWVPTGPIADGVPGTGVNICGDRPGTAAYEPDHFAAIAVSDTTLASGYSWGWYTRVQAERAALVQCRKWAADCKVVDWAQNECLSLAKSAKENTWGVDAASDRETASAKALKQCRSFNGKSCVVVTNSCSEN